MARKKSEGTAIAVIPNGHDTGGAKHDEQAEKLPTVQELMVPAALLLAAESVSAKADSERPYFCGVFLRAQDGKGRISGTDGKRAFLASFPVAGEMPAWMKDGIILSNEGLKARVSMIAKAGERSSVRLRFAEGQPKIEMSDTGSSMVFQASRVTGAYPDIARHIPAGSLGALDGDGNPVGREWEPIGINSSYLKHVGDLARTLDAGLDKSARSKTGMIVRAFNAGNDPMQPLLFDFSTYPGAILMISPVRLSGKGISAETSALLAPAIKLTLAALRAHATRNLAWAEGTQDEHQKAQFLAKAEAFNERVAVILKNAPGLPALGTEAPQPDPEDDWNNRSSGDAEGRGDEDGEAFDRPGDPTAEEGDDEDQATA